jgi:ubiquinone/menaquinone biosynthesis C-methylase UbiE
VIVDEKLDNRLMGVAILALPSDDATIFDVGCGACRVAHMVSSAGKGRATSIDISLQTLRDAKTHNPNPVLNADNMRLPVRSDVADLVISNGVIMVTPDARASFGELARITTPHCTFHTVEEVLGWGEECGLRCEEHRSEAANQLISFRFQK